MTQLTIEINNKDHIRSFEQIELIDLFGNVLVNEKVQSNSIHPTLYTTLRKFEPPVKSFFFYIRVEQMFILFYLIEISLCSLGIWY